MRYTDKVSINVDMPKGIVGAKDQGSERANEEWDIPPLLLITFVENAFKHGVSYRQESFIDLYIGIEDGQLIFRCRNSKAQEANQEKGGVGLTNVKKRLDLIYGTNYTLNIKDDDTYSVDLRINKKAHHD
jgi:sensor histidine kinase YesM